MQVTTFATDTGSEEPRGVNVPRTINEDGWMEHGLNAHNQLRKKHGVPPLTLTSDVSIGRPNMWLDFTTSAAPLVWL